MERPLAIRCYCVRLDVKFSKCNVRHEECVYTAKQKRPWNKAERHIPHFVWTDIPEGFEAHKLQARF